MALWNVDCIMHVMILMNIIKRLSLFVTIPHVNGRLPTTQSGEYVFLSVTASSCLSLISAYPSFIVAYDIAASMLASSLDLCSRSYCSY